MTYKFKNIITELNLILNLKPHEPYGSSDSEEMSKLTGINSLMHTYKLPQNIEYAQLEKNFLQKFSFFFFFREKEKLTHYLSKENQKDIDNFINFLLKKDNYFLQKIKKFNDELIKLNPKLNKIQRANNFDFEYHLACGVIYKRNPDDIEHFLKTREHSKKNIESIDDKVITKTNFFTACYYQILNHYLKEQQKPTIKKRWVISPKTLINSLNELGVSVQFKNKRQNDSINQIVKHVDLLNKRPIQVRPKIWI